MSVRLNQIIAVVSGKKTKVAKALGDVYQSLSKPTLFEGIIRTYSPTDDQGEVLPSERKYVQSTVDDAIKSARQLLTELIDATATQDVGNTHARADVKVDGAVVLRSVPVTTLLFLEKQLTDIHTFMSKLPTLDPADQWTYSAESDCYETEEIVRNHTKKVMKNHVRAEATDKHPAQVEVYNEDVVVGRWKTIKLSGAIPVKRKNDLIRRVESLQEAIKFAREEANMLEIEQVKISDSLFSYILS